MKKWFTILFFVAFQVVGFGQNNCSSSSDEPENCIFRCDKAIGNTNGFTADSIMYSNCGNSLRTQWFALKAEGDFIQIRNDGIGCPITNSVTAQFYDENFNSISVCATFKKTTTGAILRADNLVAGNTYFLMVNGEGNSNCSFNFQITGNESESVGSLGDISYNPLSGKSGGEVFITPVSGAKEYFWTISDPETTIISGQGTTKMEYINRDNEIGEICVSLLGNCRSYGRKCIQIPINDDCVPDQSDAHDCFIRCPTDIKLRADNYGDSFLNKNIDFSCSAPNVEKTVWYTVTARDTFLKVQILQWAYLSIAFARIQIFDIFLNPVSSCALLDRSVDYNINPLTASDIVPGEKYFIVYGASYANDDWTDLDLTFFGNETYAEYDYEIDYQISVDSTQGIAFVTDSLHQGIYQWRVTGNLEIISDNYSDTLKYSDNLKLGGTVCLKVFSYECAEPKEKCKTIPRLAPPTPELILSCSDSLPINNCPPGQLLCTDNYSGSTDGFSKTFASGAFPCGTIENNQFFSFIAGPTGSVSVSFFHDTCLYGRGIQGIILDQSYNPIDSCFSSEGSMKNDTITADSLIPGETYLLLIDGFAGDQCDFTINLSGIESSATIGLTPPIQNQSVSCSDSIICFSIPPPQAAAYYDWDIPDFVKIYSGGSFSDNFICLKYLYFNAPPDSLNVTPYNPCSAGVTQSILLDSKLTSDITPLNWQTSTCISQITTYEISGGSHTDSINWQITNGTITSGIGTNKIEVNWNNSGMGRVCAQYINSCGTGNQYCEDVQISIAPNSNFSNQSTICTTEPTTITYTGTAPSTANFNWSFQNATILSGSGAGPYQVSYPTTGGYQISLEVEENGCTSPLTEQTIVVNDRLAPFSVNCSSTVDEITFSWNPVQGASNYRVNSLTGQSGILNGTTYVVSGLSPNEEVSLEIFAESGVGCAASSTTKTCTAQDCPPVSVSISPIADICLNQMTAPIQLFAQQNGGSGTGSFTWSGPGITPNGMFDPNASNIGTIQIETRYTEGSCEYFASQIINIFNSPAANFLADAVVCLGDEVTVTYTGNAGGSAIYNWDFGNAIIISGSGRGPYQILPDLSGTFTISLEVEENGCVSPIESQTVQADEQLIPPVISCNISTTNFLTFGWNDVSGNAGYSVRVLTGQTGVLTGTNYEVNGLSPGEEVSIELTVLSSNSCPPQLATLTCVTTSCPPIIVSIDSLQMPICFGDSLQIQLNSTLTNSSGNGIFNWSGAGVSSTGILDISGLPSGDLPISLIYEENGCTYSANTIITIQSEIDLDEKILSPIWYPGNSGSVELTVSGGTPPYIYGWSQFPVSEPAIRDVPPGEYCVTVIDNVGCAALNCYTIGAGIFRTSPLVLMCTGDTKKLSVRPGRGADFKWSLNDGLSCTDCPSPNASPSKSTIYNVSAAMPDGRAESTNVAVIVLPPFICNLASTISDNEISALTKDFNLEKIGQKELFEIENRMTAFLTKKTVKVFPNPTSGKVTILSFSEVEKTEVFDISGRKIFESDESEIDISAFAKGVYFFKIKTEGKTVVKRVVLI